jgi:diamine N-acetyltransferase
MNTKIRLAKIEDYLYVSELMQNVHVQHVKGLPGFYKQNENAMSREYFVDAIEKEQIYVLDDNEGIVGFALIEWIDIVDNPVIHNQKMLYIIDICINETNRKKGYGRVIFNNLENIAREKKCRSIDLDVYTFNVGAKKFYQKMKMNENKIGMTKIL